MSGEASGFALRAGALALAAGAVVAAAVAPAGFAAVAWALGGWAVTAATGVLGGVRMNSAWGGTGAEFLVALGTCMLARLFGAALGAAIAAWAGSGAVWPYLAGLAAGYVPLQAFEVAWFWRRPARRVA